MSPVFSIPSRGTQYFVKGGFTILDLKSYRFYLLENETSRNTIKNYITTLKQLDGFLEAYNKQLTKDVLIEFKEYLKNYEYSLGKKYTLKTINQKIVILNIYFNWLGSPELSLKTLKVQQSVHRESINKKEYRLILKYADEEMQLFVLLIGNAGLRISEACAITVDDVERKIIEVRNKEKTRFISIPQFVKKKLRKFCMDRTIYGTIFYKSQTLYRRKLKQIAGKAKINKDKVYPHSIRHFFAKEFISNGGDSTELQQMLGHENISTTTIYTKLSSNELSEKFRSIRNE